MLKLLIISPLVCVISKLISKVITNRLRMILSNLIYDSQNAFVVERKITNNVLIAYELIHFLRRKRRGKQGLISIKFDMSKAYERVESNYLERVMLTMEFK